MPGQMSRTPGRQTRVLHPHSRVDLDWQQRDRYTHCQRPPARPLSSHYCVNEPVLQSKWTMRGVLIQFWTRIRWSPVFVYVSLDRSNAIGYPLSSLVRELFFSWGPLHLKERLGFEVRQCCITRAKIKGSDNNPTNTANVCYSHVTELYERFALLMRVAIRSLWPRLGCNLSVTLTALYATIHVYTS